MTISNRGTAECCEIILELLLPFDVVFTPEAVNSNVVTFQYGVHTGSNLFNKSYQYLVNGGCVR